MAYSGYYPATNMIIVSWRGTIPDDWDNWIEDFSFEHLSYQKCVGCKVHAGFYLSTWSIFGRVLRHFDTLLKAHPDAKVVITGSSMGGALATIAALDFQADYGRVDELHIFGTPRTGNIAFAKYLTRRIPNTIRVIHNRDVIPHVPYVSQNYYHGGTEVLLSEDLKNYKICSEGI